MSDWNWAQWAVLIIYLLSVGFAIVNDGKPHTSPTFKGGPPVAAAVIMTLLLVIGGFWS